MSQRTEGGGQESEKRRDLLKAECGMGKAESEEKRPPLQASAMQRE